MVFSWIQQSKKYHIVHVKYHRQSELLGAHGPVGIPIDARNRNDQIYTGLTSLMPKLAAQTGHLRRRVSIIL